MKKAEVFGKRLSFGMFLFMSGVFYGNVEERYSHLGGYFWLYNALGCLFLTGWFKFLEKIKNPDFEEQDG